LSAQDREPDGLIVDAVDDNLGIFGRCQYNLTMMRVMLLLLLLLLMVMNVVVRRGGNDAVGLRLRTHDLFPELPDLNDLLRCTLVVYGFMLNMNFAVDHLSCFIGVSLGNLNYIIIGVRLILFCDDNFRVMTAVLDEFIDTPSN
jgi:hypothetical protein